MKVQIKRNNIVLVILFLVSMSGMNIIYSLNNEATKEIVNSHMQEDVTVVVNDDHKEEPKTVRKNKRKVMMCAIVFNEEAYIDEWIDYHYALGFDEFHVYDNSKGFEMRQWAEKKGDHVRVTHFPGAMKQVEAYQKCAKMALEEGYVWAAFFDLDEFLQLKKHENVVEFLEEHASSGSIGINWVMFEPIKEDLLYRPFPVTKRFMYRYPDAVPNLHIKSIVKLSDMDMNHGLIHNAHLKNGTQHDTNNHSFSGPFNKNGPTDVAVLYHYHKKSHKEYVAKRQRGGVSTPQEEVPEQIKQAEEWFDKALDPTDNSFNPATENMVYDDLAWKAMKKYVPHYAVYDDLEDKSKAE
jgi:hypothetical protein